MFTTISKVFSKLYFWTCGGAGSRKSGDRGDFNPSSGDNKWGIRGERLCLCVRHVCPVCLCLLPVFLLTCLTITPVSIHPDKRPTRPSRLGQTVQSPTWIFATISPVLSPLLGLFTTTSTSSSSQTPRHPYPQWTCSLIPVSWLLSTVATTTKITLKVYKEEKKSTTLFNIIYSWQPWMSLGGFVSLRYGATWLRSCSWSSRGVGVLFNHS